MFNISVNDKKNIYRSKPVMNVDTVPKPLTYDYMPEGYPKKVEFTGTLMEEQSVTNGPMTNPIVPIEGKTYTVNFEGTDYNCVCHRYEDTERSAIIFYIGNPTFFGIQGETSEPFLYAYVISNLDDNYTQGVWIFYDDAGSHTVSVQGAGIKTETISPSFLPTGDDSPYELKEVGTKKVYVAEFHVESSDTAEKLYNKVNTAYSNGYYVLLYYYAYNDENNARIYNLSNSKQGTFYFSHLEMINGVAPIEVIKLYRSDGQYKMDFGTYEPYYKNKKESAPLSFYLKSSVSQKLFEIKVDGSGNLSATEVT